MLIHDLEQGSEAWRRIRLGVPTTSRFADIITPTGRKTSGRAWDGYLSELIGQLISGVVEDQPSTYAMRRGNELEPVAVDYYAQYKQVTPRAIGFVTTKDGRIGCSPDRLVDRDGLLEVKCPMMKQHTENLISGEIDPKYIPQVQGQLLLTKRRWCDWMSYHPDMPPSIVRCEVDIDYQEALKEYLNDFLVEMDEIIEMLTNRGIEFAIKVKPREVGVVEGV